jgi:hypothetical protein
VGAVITGPPGLVAPVQDISLVPGAGAVDIVVSEIQFNEDEMK